jgi:hypothetical protein
LRYHSCLSVIVSDEKLIRKRGAQDVLLTDPEQHMPAYMIVHLAGPEKVTN